MQLNEFVPLSCDDGNDGRPEGEPVTEKSLSFDTRNHDDVLSIVERLQARGDLPNDTAASLGVGLKLFGEVVLEHRNDPLFAPLREPLQEFIARRKGCRPDLNSSPRS